MKGGARLLLTLSMALACLARPAAGFVASQSLLRRHALASVRCLATGPARGNEGDGGLRGGESLQSLTVVKLKERLREAGLPVSGTKQVLIDRLLSGGTQPEGKKSSAAKRELEAVLKGRGLNVSFRGHQRKGWDPLPLEDPPRPTKGAFTVMVKGMVVAETGPEPRPFTDLRELDMEGLGDKVQAALFVNYDPESLVAK